MNLMSSTLLVEDTGVPFDELQAEQIARFRAAWAEAGWQREPRVSVSRSVLPIVTDLDRRYFGDRAARDARPGRLPRGRARAVRARATSASPTSSPRSCARDAAVREADTLLLTVPNQLGVDYNARLLETIVRHIAPAIGWSRRRTGSPEEEPGDVVGL